MWYVRNIDTGVVSGPMDQDAADALCGEDSDAVMFSDSVFKFEDLSSLPESRAEFIAEFHRLIDDVHRMLAAVSRPRCVIGTLHGGVLEIPNLPVGVRVEITDDNDKVHIWE